MGSSKPARAVRPNYNHIHRYPLPLDVFPLPPLIPHNPLSLLQIAYTYISQLVSPPSSHTSNIVHGIFHPESNSVHVTNRAQVRLLWERGFFGKGSLSRSEPTWLDRERKRLGLAEKDTSEEWRQKRREERRAMKMERARQQQEAIDEKLVEEGMNEAGHTPIVAVDDVVTDRATPKSSTEDETTRDEPLRATQYSLPNADEQMPENPVLDSPELPTEQRGEPPDSFGVDLQNQEHLQLSAEEAFFLSYALGILRVHDDDTEKTMAPDALLTTFRSHSYFPPFSATDLMPYDPFLLSYVAYHHFRSLGWVVRPGIKFAVDWLLYLRGPPFHHAEFAVMILPSFRDDYWWEDSRKTETERRERRDWWWLHCVQRVQAQVRKGLVICWVEVPRPEDVAASPLAESEKEAAESKGIEEPAGIGIGSMLKKYKFREFVVKRWIPNRNRD